MALLLTFLVAGLLSAVSCQQKCLRGNHHKPLPSAEPDLMECTLYSESSCCRRNLTEKLSHSLTELDNFYWNRCGNLSKSCEDYLKKIECFYQCSPSVAHWAHPNISVAIQRVPLCQSFCDNWYNACRSDMWCAYNWLTDWTFDDTGNHCKNICIPFHEMYANGIDVCQHMWGNSFAVSSSPCRCLDMTETDRNVMKYILEGDDKSEESGEEEACKPRLHRSQEPDDKQVND
ncbi:riboflavin-binding protein [Bombina bombina]|uniref:riboflavin-binding protein n=1 Tax=Bombina bombina TaxID=8345 RepID=UPI00235B2262|nr:riboflavin-binding protein [Bombina bombina]